jgi:hypothetical protein
LFRVGDSVSGRLRSARHGQHQDRPHQRLAEAHDAFQADVLAYTGDDLASELSSKLSLAQYLRWLAMMSTFENGDYIDEVWFVSTDQLGVDGVSTE